MAHEYPVGSQVKINVSKISRLVSDAKNLGDTDEIVGEVTGHDHHELITGEVKNLYDVEIVDYDLNLRRLAEDKIVGLA